MYLGISCYNHESAAALIDNNGNLINYYREESLSRVKSDKSFPKRSIKKIFEPQLRSGIVVSIEI